MLDGGLCPCDCCAVLLTWEPSSLQQFAQCFVQSKCPRSFIGQHDSQEELDEGAFFSLSLPLPIVLF